MITDHQSSLSRCTSVVYTSPSPRPIIGRRRRGSSNCKQRWCVKSSYMQWGIMGLWYAILHLYIYIYMYSIITYNVGVLYMCTHWFVDDCRVSRMGRVRKPSFRCGILLWRVFHDMTYYPYFRQSHQTWIGGLDREGGDFDEYLRQEICYNFIDNSTIVSGNGLKIQDTNSLPSHMEHGWTWTVCVKFSYELLIFQGCCLFVRHFRLQRTATHKVRFRHWPCIGGIVFFYILRRISSYISVYIYIYIYIILYLYLYYVHTYVYIYTCIYLYKCICIYMYIYIYKCICIYIYIYLCILYPCSI